MTTQRETKLQHDQWYDEAISAGDKLADAGVPELKAVNSERLVASLKNLRGEAAKVPGLEADNAALLEALRSARGALGDAQPNIGWGTPPRLVCGKAYDAACAVADADHPGAALLDRLATLKSERDAARQTVSAAASRERELMARTSLAESDRDIAKGEVDVLREQLKEARKDAKEALAEHQHLLERVVTLERELKDLKWCEEGNGIAADSAIARFETAEARVKELEAQLAGALELPGIRGDCEPCNIEAVIGTEEVPHPVDGRLHTCQMDSKPPPSPAQGVTDPMHPTGRCTCGGEGTCAWCRAEPETCEECGDLGGHSYLPVHGAEVPRICSRAPQPPTAPAQVPEDATLTQRLRDLKAGEPPIAFKFTREPTPTTPALVVPEAIRTALAGYLYEADGLHGPVRELLAPGGRGRLTLATLRQVADLLGVKPGVSR